MRFREIDFPFPKLRSKEHAHQFFRALMAAHPDLSDIDFQTRHPPMVQIHGKRYALRGETDESDILTLINSCFTHQTGKGDMHNERLGINTILAIPLGGNDWLRFRFNAVLCQLPGTGRNDASGVQISLRYIPSVLPDWRQLGIPEELIRGVWYPDGIVLVTGPTGSGKTTTLAAMIRHALEENEELVDHKVITAESPIEFLYNHPRISQSQVPSHLREWYFSNVEAMRRNPDIILIGEVRDRESIRTAIEASMTGHLVMTTVHVTYVSDAVSRLVKAFGPEEAPAMAADILESLRIAIAQRLVIGTDGRRVAVREWLFFDRAMRRALMHVPPVELATAIQEQVDSKGHSYRTDADQLLAAGRITPQQHAYILRGFD
ncbi:Flp pilus assembly complex ATPase component TadA [Acidithiobacillus ferriphilus]|uniref:type IV pilus twitching motility protein PilT n=1 Tax=Acidithiobacillus ferriphilus TaxID=1689834 RepID=UPI001C0739B7|nr:ATPase, T2SS/T4P/T4SS family [Acidithiobacillus ferriphilus]MBU2845221.1 Flp pilus assembly complex ATPase component TadA [Acidithiobacillus ferriphilus]MEB8474432.1 ATPase, T2SS/T4P/T4SS family [Acidithiobacillus ferriphilus]